MEALCRFWKFSFEFRLNMGPWLADNGVARRSHYSRSSVVMLQNPIFTIKKCIALTNS